MILPAMADHESLQRAIHEDVALHAYNPPWPALFEAEKTVCCVFPADRPHDTYSQVKMPVALVLCAQEAIKSIA
jgi:hypothetical protein